MNAQGNSLNIEAAGTQFTCFTGTKIQIMTLRAAVHNAGIKKGGGR
jgi:hypothetical protein